MDINILRGLITLCILLLFLAICVWAYSAKRKQDFAEAARLPLLEDNDPPLTQQQHANKENQQ